MENPVVKHILQKCVMHPYFTKEHMHDAPIAIFEDNKIYGDIFRIVQTHYKGNSKPLGESALWALTLSRLDNRREPQEIQEQYYDSIRELYDLPDSADGSVLDEEAEKFIKRKKLMKLQMDLAMAGDDMVKSEKIIDEMVKVKLMNISTKRKEIVNVLSDTEYVMNALETLNQSSIPTGFSSIDNLNGGGLSKGELGLILAMSGRGKTMTLINLAANYVRSGKNVLFIALEELENRMLLKLNQATYRRQKSELLSGNSVNREMFKALANIYTNNKDKLGTLLLSRFSPRTVTPAKIEQLIMDSIYREGITPDVVIIDYPELLRNPNATGNEADDGGKLFEEMRRIGQDYNVVMWTAGQLNRKSYGATLLTSEHMEGSLRKKNAAELILVVNQSNEEFNGGFTRLYADKVRNPPDGPYEKMLGFKVIGQTMTIREYLTEEEREEHRGILMELEQKSDIAFKNKKDGDLTKSPVNANNINDYIKNGRR